MKKTLAIGTLIFLFCGFAAAQIAVNPTGVNVNSQNPTSVFLTFGPIPAGYSPAEAQWCGSISPAPPPAIGNRCAPGTIYGTLPARLNISASSGNAGFTDIMGIPSSVVRRAYQAAAGGGDSGFFYVRRFVSASGDPDQFVAVTCRMAGGGARVPFALTNVELETGNPEQIVFVKKGGPLPNITANIKYNGTGRLRGRWEVVQPGEDDPEPRDLLTEASIPVEQRPLQRRYTEIARFSHFLPPVGEFKLELEAGKSLSAVAEGRYLILLRIEAVDDKESSSNLASVGVGNGTVRSGAVASFPMPVFKFFVVGNVAGWGKTGDLVQTNAPIPGANGSPLFAWPAHMDAESYRISVSNFAGEVVFSAITPKGVLSYTAPSWFWQKFDGQKLKWKVTAFDPEGNQLAESSPKDLLRGI